MKEILTAKEKILKEASRLFSEFGFLNTSMREIATNLGLSKPALYYHFKDKKELYLEVLEGSFKTLKEALTKCTKTGSPQKKLSSMIGAYLLFGSEEKNLIRSQLLKTSKIDPEIRKKVLELRKRTEGEIGEIFQQILKKEIIQKIDLKTFTSLLLGMMDGLILKTILFGEKMDAPKRTSQILKVISPILNSPC